jgi:hypothetical protein
MTIPMTFGAVIAHRERENNRQAERKRARDAFGDWQAAGGRLDGSGPLFYRQACRLLGYPDNQEMRFDGAGRPYPYGWDSVAGCDDAADPFASPDNDSPIPYALPVGPQDEWDTDRGPEFYDGREDELRKYIVAGCPDLHATGLARLSAPELRKLWEWLAKLAGVA